MSQYNYRSYESSDTSTFVMGLKIFGYTVLCGIMCLFITMSLKMMSNGMCLENAGKWVTTEKPDGTVIEEYISFAEHPEAEREVITVEGEDKVSAVFVTQVKSGAFGVLYVVFQVVEQAIGLLILFGIAGYYVHREGDRDRNLVKHHERTPTPLRGLWIGLIAAVPSFLVYGMLIVGKCGFFHTSVQGLYRLFNMAYRPLLNIIMPATVVSVDTPPSAVVELATEIPILTLVVLFGLVLVFPAACAVSYTLGYKRVFKKKKKKRA